MPMPSLAAHAIRASFAHRDFSLSSACAESAISSSSSAPLPNPPSSSSSSSRLVVLSGFVLLIVLGLLSGFPSTLGLRFVIDRDECFSHSVPYEGDKVHVSFVVIKSDTPWHYGDDVLILWDPNALVYSIKRSCENKAHVVSLDEREGGVRATLNLGHTFGHAIENGIGYGQWLHGEAVAAGMVMAADISHRLGWIDDTIVERILLILQHSNLPTAPPDVMTVEKFKDIMAVDKKVADGLLQLTLLKGPLGSCVFSWDYDNKAIHETLRAFCKC